MPSVIRIVHLILSIFAGAFDCNALEQMTLLIEKILGLARVIRHWLVKFKSICLSISSVTPKWALGLTILLAVYLGFGLEGSYAQQPEKRGLDWFIEISAGTGIEASTMRHEELFIANACESFDECQPQQGGNWLWELGRASGAYSAIAAELRFKSLGFELSVAKAASRLNMSFESFRPDLPFPIYTFIGGGGSLSATSLTGTALYTVSMKRLALSVGAGLGLSQTAIRTPLHDSADICIPGLVCYLDIHRYYVTSYEDAKNRGISRHLQVGLEFEVGEGLAIGLKGVYSIFGKTTGTFDYQVHPEIGAVSFESSEPRPLVVAVTASYNLGRLSGILR